MFRCLVVFLISRPCTTCWEEWVEDDQCESRLLMRTYRWPCNMQELYVSSCFSWMLFTFYTVFVSTIVTKRIAFIRFAFLFYLNPESSGSTVYRTLVIRPRRAATVTNSKSILKSETYIIYVHIYILVMWSFHTCSDSYHRHAEMRHDSFQPAAPIVDASFHKLVDYEPCDKNGSGGMRIFWDILDHMSKFVSWWRRSSFAVLQLTLQLTN